MPRRQGDDLSLLQAPLDAAWRARRALFIDNMLWHPSVRIWLLGLECMVVGSIRAFARAHVQSSHGE